MPRMFVRFLALALLFTGVVQTSQAENAHAPPTFDAVDKIECNFNVWPITCEVTGINCLPTCFTGFCCHFS